MPCTSLKVYEEALTKLNSQEQWVLDFVTDICRSEVVDQSNRVILYFLLMAVP